MRASYKTPSYHRLIAKSCRLKTCSLANKFTVTRHESNMSYISSLMDFKIISLCLILVTNCANSGRDVVFFIYSFRFPNRVVWVMRLPFCFPCVNRFSS